MATIGRYRIRRRLGVGGMAEVLEAEALGDAGFVRRVAVKRMLGAAKDDESFARMFLDEARIASRLHHANIVSVLDYGVVDGTPFQVLELVDGVDARSLIRRSEGGRVPEVIALYIVAQIGHALATAHGARDDLGQPSGIVHRDVSPGNVLVSWDGDVKLADFGIAFAKDKTEKTETGVTKGTLIYMSPEQATTGRVDARSDIFSLGCVLHALVTGKSPLADGGAQRIHATRAIELGAIPSDDVRSIIEMATRFDREQRFQSALAMTEAVGRAMATRLDGEPRRRLVQYLSPLRAKLTEPIGRLDALLCVDIVVDERPTERHFHTASVEATQTSLDPGSESTVLWRGAPPVPPPPATPKVARSRKVLGGALAITGVVAIAGLAAFLRPSLAARPQGVFIDASADAAVEPSAASAAPSIETIPVATAPSAPSVDASSPSARPLRREPVLPPRPSAPPTTACTGTIFLSCPSSPRAPISIDGSVSNYHHGDFATVSCDRHAIVFQASDGRQDRHGASPTSANTRTSPLEVRCHLD